jgi:Fic family protein
MKLTLFYQKRLTDLRDTFISLRKGKDSLLVLLDEAELSECVYNSNAIENSTLTLQETERILLEMELSRAISLREAFEAKNLAAVMKYIRDKSQEMMLTKETMLLLHLMLMGNINTKIAGRFRQKDEFVRIGTYIAAHPKYVNGMIEKAIDTCNNDLQMNNFEKIAWFHLEFERIHPFIDGNGRIGRVLLNMQLVKAGFPPIIIRNKEKKYYYDAFREYEDDNKKDLMQKVVYIALIESLHKRIAYLEGAELVELSQFAKIQSISIHVLLNKARRQTIPAFREKGVWKIRNDFQVTSSS